MKNTCCIIMFLLCLTYAFSTKVYAQKVVVKANLLGVLSGNLGGSVEGVLGERMSIVLHGSYLTSSQSDDIGGIAVTKEKGYTISPELRFYPSTAYEVAPKGLFLGANALYESINVEIRGIELDSLDTDGTATNYGFGIVLGNQWVFNDRFAIEVSFSPYYKITNLEGNLNPRFYEQKEGFRFDRIGLSVGVAF